MQRANDSHNSRRGPNTLGPRDLQSWRGCVPPVPWGGCAYGSHLKFETALAVLAWSCSFKVIQTIITNAAYHAAKRYAPPTSVGCAHTGQPPGEWDRPTGGHPTHGSQRCIKLAFQDADTDILAGILARIVERMSACHRNNFRKSRVSDVSARGCPCRCRCWRRGIPALRP